MVGLLAHSTFLKPHKFHFDADDALVVFYGDSITSLRLRDNLNQKSATPIFQTNARAQSP
jgi:hypothetical protein